MSKTKKDLERLNESLKGLIKVAKKEIKDRDKLIAELTEESKGRWLKWQKSKELIEDLEDEIIENEDYIFQLQNTIVQTQIKKHNKRIK